jgi:hypothetical protein
MSFIFGPGLRAAVDFQRSADKIAAVFKPPELDHICCCNPAKAMCGAFVAGQDVKFGGPEKAKNPCQECFNRAADGERCGAPDCPGGEE